MPNQNVSLAILFADISGSSRLYETLGDKEALSRIERCLMLLSAQAVKHGGKVLKTIGDEVMCAFPDAAAAVRTARAMQMEMAMQLLSGKLPLHIHIGLHFGEALRGDDDIFGDAVNIAARLTELAKADQILTSRDTADLLPASLRADLRQLGNFGLKGKREEIDMCEILWQEAGGDLTLMPGTLTHFEPAIASLMLQHGSQHLTMNAGKPSCILGRDKDNDLVVSNPLASRQHALIELRNGRFTLRDQSTNGTYVFSEGGRKSFVHREEFPLSGSGSISLGHDTEGDPDSPLTIRYTCE